MSTPNGLRRLCVFCGSSAGLQPIFKETARAMGRLLAERSLELVYGGGKVGLMGAVADGCLAHGGRAIGVIPKALVEREIAHTGLTELRIVNSMHERKALMADLADAFIALPGGFGTWDEFCEIVTWAQLGIHQKGCALLNVNGYYDPLLAMTDRAVAEGFLPAAHRDMLLTESDPARLLDRLKEYVAPEVGKWVSREDR